VGEAGPPLDAAELRASLDELYRVAACGGRGALPERFRNAKVESRCRQLGATYAEYTKRWITRSAPFFAAIRPAALPRRVVYPFGGGDLVTALTVFPDADEYTTISLEPAGDVRRIDTLDLPDLERSLEVSARHLRKLLRVTYSRTTNLGIEGRSALPGEVVFLLAALVVHGYEPTGARYFTIGVDGGLHYATHAELELADREPHAPGLPPPGIFSNIEIRFRKGDGPEKIVRHISQDLSNQELGKRPGLVAHLASKGNVSAMTKAASHLLWADEFATIRNYLLEHVVWMVSDSTGLPPRFADAAGFVQVPYGRFETPAKYGPIELLDARGFRHLFARETPRPLSFQFGYLDGHHHSHLVVTRKPVVEG